MQVLNQHRLPDQTSFFMLQSLLEEMVNTLKSQYLHYDIGDEQATLEVGLGHDKTVWTVYAAGDGGTFTVDKTQYYYREKEEDAFSFEGEPETVEYLVKEIVEKIVYCRYLYTEDTTALNPASHG